MAFKPQGDGGVDDNSPEMSDDFGSALDALDKLSSGQLDTQPEEAQTEDTFVEENSENYVDEEQQDFLEEDNEDASFDEEDIELPETEQPSEVPELEIKAAKGLHKFKLDPENEELIKTLQLGVGARPAFSKAAKLEKEVKSLREQLGSTSELSEKAQLVDDFQELMEKGFYEQAAQALFGEQYEHFRKQAIISHVDYENSSPEEQYELDRQKMKQERDWLQYQKDREIDRKTSELNQLREQQQEERWMGIGSKLLQKYSMDNYIDDPVLAEEYNEELWSSVWNTMEASYPEPSEWTPTLLNQVFAKKARLFRGALQKQVTSRLNKATEAKKETAKTQAQMMARRNHTSSKGNDLKSKLKQSASALDRLNILSGGGF